jgi:hypothetical protein
MDLRTKCEAFPIQRCQLESDQASEVEIEFKTLLERVLYHSNWCRMCGYLLRNLCRPENDAFRHPQVAPYLQAHLRGKTFKQWVDAGRRYSDRQWPFWYGKERHEGALHYLDPVVVNQQYKDHAVLLTKQLIPMMMKVAVATHSNKPYAQKETMDDIRTGHMNLAKERKKTGKRIPLMVISLAR